MAIIETSALDATNVQTAFEAIIKGKQDSKADLTMYLRDLQVINSRAAAVDRTQSGKRLEPTSPTTGHPVTKEQGGQVNGRKGIARRPGEKGDQEEEVIMLLIHSPRRLLNFHSFDVYRN